MRRAMLNFPGLRHATSGLCVRFRRTAAQERKRPHRLILGSIVLAVLILSSFFVVLMEGREDAKKNAVDTSRNVALVLERDITRNFELFDLSLQALRNNVLDPNVMKLDSRVRDSILFDRAALSARHMGAMLFVDASGAVQIDSSYTGQPGINVSDRDYFQVHQRNPHAGLFIGKPTLSRLHAGLWVIPFSRRVERTDGSFAGVVVGAIGVDYFRALLDGVDIGTNGVVALLTSDGTIVTRHPFRRVDVGASLKNSANFQHFVDTGESAFFGYASLDADRHLYVFERAPTVPFIIFVAPAEEDVYAAWERRSLLIGSAAVALCAALIGLAFALSREFQRRISTENALHILARTDPLTGASNRRYLDEAIARETVRAIRSSYLLSVLFIDIDSFKAFNDCYGHQAGDDVLAKVARRIRECLRRPGDLAARYGGEEFVVVLPETDIAGALAVAQTVREAIHALGVQHARSEHRVLTVSIGVCASEAVPTASGQRLVEVADQALYRAKAAGRDRVAASLLSARGEIVPCDPSVVEHGSAVRADAALA
jgi:diguanylate cyclase (GGDEF)-like protein